MTLATTQDDTDGAKSDTPTKELDTTTSLEALQRDEQRLVLDTVAKVRKCGLESILSLPQLVVCGDQSAGKSSVLEALTEIPFPRNDNLCTRFATEIILRRATVDSLTIKVIPDSKRPAEDQEPIKAFKESITNFGELPSIMDKAMAIMGIDTGPQSRAFAKDVLSIEIEGPSRPQLTLVDLPGLIQTESKGVTTADVELVREITDQYISQPRTICLAVVSATNDYANQGILTKVRKVDPDGERTLGIITKPDRLPADSGSESAFLNLARNNDIFFKLGWHVLKNRTFEERASSFMERNASEASYFRKSNFRHLPKECVGIDTLRDRLSLLLFEHVKQELPKLQDDLNEALADASGQLELMGNRRVTPQDCRDYLMQLSLDFHMVCKAAVDGNYEGDYFNHDADQVFSHTSPASIRRLRAVVQSMNTSFAQTIRTKGHTYYIDRTDRIDKTYRIDTPPAYVSQPTSPLQSMLPKTLSHSEALTWVSQAIIRNRGRELQGNFNPLLIGELFWQQSSKWRQLALEHVEQVAQVCTQFLESLFQEKCPRDIHSRLWSARLKDALKIRNEEEAVKELDLIMEDFKSYPINYNRYYIDTVRKCRRARERESLAECLRDATKHSHLPGCNSDHTSASIDVDRALESYAQSTGPDMEHHSCEEALDCLIAIYKVFQKIFIANITIQVIERHIVRGLEKIFSPVVVNGLSDADVEGIASEPASAKRQRAFLDDRISKLKEGRDILRSVMTRTVL